MRQPIAALALVAAAVATGIAGQAELPTAPPHVIGIVHFIHATDTLEATTAFYKDVCGPRQGGIRDHRVHECRASRRAGGPE